jgi:hypothetical protein
MDCSSELPIFFMGTAYFAWKPHRLYRVYILQDELVFVWAGSPGAMAKGLPSVGPIGTLLAAAISPEDSNQARQKLLDSAGLNQIRGNHKFNFCINRENVSEVRIEPQSFWLAAFNQHLKPHVGVMRFLHPEMGKFRLCILTAENMGIALEHIPITLAEKVTVDVEWDRRKQKYVRKK